MMNLITAPNEILTRKLKPIDFNKFDVAKLSQDMMTIMNVKGGIGLSANQIGVDAQIFVMRSFLNKTLGERFAVINPVIKEVSKKMVLDTEGCLSFPNVFLKVKRPFSCVVEFMTLNSNMTQVFTTEQEFIDIDARIFLHEYDHLQGIQFIDRVGRVKLELAEKRKNKRKKINA
jgi:peptide deformylase